MPDIVIPSRVDNTRIGEDALEHALPWDQIEAVPHNRYYDFSSIITDQDNNVIEENVKEPSELPEGQTWTQTGTKPVYQGIDQGKLVPLLVKSLQEALADIDNLKAEVAALKNA